MSIRSERRYISQSDLKPGIMIEFNYTKADGSANKYQALVIDPNRKNEHAREPQLHAVLIEDMDDSQLLQLFSIFRKPINFDPDNREGSVVESLNDDDAYGEFVGSRYAQTRKYRTFNLSGISQLRQILLGSVGE